jgi:predicted XRE-type DNA-binding protein
MAKFESLRRGSGNVFADLGLPRAEERLAKAELARAIGKAIGARRLTQLQAAELLGVDQPKVSHVLSGRLDGFSTERLLRFLTSLGRDVEIRVKRGTARRRGRLHVVAR